MFTLLHSSLTIPEYNKINIAIARYSTYIAMVSNDITGIAKQLNSVKQTKMPKDANKLLLNDLIVRTGMNVITKNKIPNTAEQNTYVPINLCCFVFV